MSRRFRLIDKYRRSPRIIASCRKSAFVRPFICAHKGSGKYAIFILIRVRRSYMMDR
jgi:hypothetical protein